MLIQRVMGVLKLDAATYEEIEADESATSQAAIVVAVVAIISGILGGAFAAAAGGSFFGTLISNIVIAFVSWFIWAGATYIVGTSVFGGKSTMGEMLRVLGFAQAPGILAFIPICGSIIGLIWTLACSFIAIRQGLDLDNKNAVITAAVAFVLVMFISITISGILIGLGLGASTILSF
jgi:hypothetical protein